MKKLTLLSATIVYTCLLCAQPSFQTSLEAGISLPLKSNGVNDTHAGKAIHFGNHLDYSFGNGSVKVGLGAYIGYINSIATDDKYKEIGEAIAEKYGFTASGLTFNSSAFKSTQILIGPVASFGSGKCKINIWAKGGYGLNEPSRYAVIYKANGAVNNIYVNQNGEHQNGLAYNAGAGIKLAISEYVGLQLSAGYFSTQTDQVNYNFDREKGLTPLYFTASNQFIQASAGLQFTIGNAAKKNNGNYALQSLENDTDYPAARPDQKIKTKSNIKNDRVINTGENDPLTPKMDQKIKTKSNIKNDRLANNNNNNANDNADNDSLFFSPEKIELRSLAPGQTTSLQSVDNYLTGFLYTRRNGAVIAQCVSGAADSDPIPGVDVHLKRNGSIGNDALTARTNKDGSFSFNNVAPGNYTATADNTSMDVTVNGNKENDLKILDINGGSCSNTKENYIINAGDKTYVEVISGADGKDMATGKKHVANVKYNDISTVAPGDAATGMASGKRMHKPYRVTDTDFDVNMDNIVSCDGKLYAEVIASREAGSGMATGRNTIVTGDVDGDGFTDYTSVSPRDAASGMPTGKRMHKPYTITKELDFTQDDANEIVSPRDAAAGLPTGKRMHKPYTITKELDITQDDANEIVSPRDAASGLPTGKRMHKPYTITKELDLTEVKSNEIVSPRDAASGLPTGKRMHKPFVVTMEADEDADQIVSARDAASGLATGKRMHKPYVITIDADENTYEVLSPRDIASGQASGKRMHKPFVITKQLGVTDDGDEVVTYRIVHRDIAARNLLMDDNADNGDEKMAITEQGLPKKKGAKKGIITRQDNDTGMFTEEDAVSNPLYQSSGNGGVNPLFEGKSELRVIGSNGKGHDIFIPSNIVINTPTASNIVPFISYEVGPVRWMAPEIMSSKKGMQEKGLKMTPDKMEANSERKGGDGSVKGNDKNINTSEDNIGSTKITKDDTGNSAERKGWDGTVKGGAVVKSISRINCADGTCTLDAIVETGGKDYEAVVRGIMKTKHDTVKNSISNIR